MKIIQTKDLCKSYGKKEAKVLALDNVNISIEENEFVSIIGASGSGKSTLLHILGTVDRPTSGKVFINGEDIFQSKDEELAKYRRSNIGFIFQFFNLVPVLTVEENIAVPFTLAGKTPDKKHLDEIIELLGLQERRKHLPNQLSGGQQQRVAIGRAIVHKPKIIFADEPTGNLDSKNTGEIMKLLKSSAKSNGQTLVVITHDPQIASYADRTIVVKDGKVDGQECGE